MINIYICHLNGGFVKISISLRMKDISALSRFWRQQMWYTFV